MRNLYVIFFVFLAQFTWAEIESGSVVVIITTNDVVTVAADSRGFETATGRQNDMECKIAAFGDYFVFALTGTTRDSMKWDAYDIAHSIWASQSKVVRDPVKLVATVANKWADEVERHLQIPESIRVIRQRLTDGNVFESAFFAATSPSGELVSSQINFFLDVDLYDKLGQIHVWHEPNKNLGMGGSSRAAIGYSEVAAEFDQQASKRAQAYMKWYLPKISLLKPTSQNAAVAEKLVELTILLHPAQEYLGFPIDELQLVRGTGIHWLHQKKSCQGQSSNSDLPKK